MKKSLAIKHIQWMTLLFLALFSYSGLASAQVVLVHNGKSKSTIIIQENTRVNQIAASLLQQFVEKITDCRLPVSLTRQPRKGDVLIGGPDSENIDVNGFNLSTDKGILRICGKKNGVVYGVVTLLEQYAGVDYWGENEYTLSKRATLEIPLINSSDNPAFIYRQTQFYGMQNDTIYKWWNRLEEPNEAFAAGYWVHTFDRLLSSDIYGKSHPEYYSFFNGKRHPGKASQWCLTNPTVFEIVSQRIDSIFKANPAMDLICVSQNDGNNTNCQCEQCKKIDDEEGSPSGSLIHFINKLAKRFPDKRIATLAYLYTMYPPKYIKPLPNVVVMLCDIDCKREVPLTDNESGRDFTKALEGWSKIASQIFVWDYGINFDNYLSPFPNFHVLQPNMQLFKKNHVNMHFSQIASSRGGDFAELRSYLVAKLMWNPTANMDSLMQHFLRGYYGDAASPIYQYIKVMQGALLASGQPLWIYDSPVSHKYGMLKPELMKIYNHLFDEAERRVAHNPTFLKRVQRTRLPLEYSELEIARTEKNTDATRIGKQLDLFEQRVKEFKVPTLNERSNSPIEYCNLYRQRYMPTSERYLSSGAKVTYLIPPAEKYAKMGETALTDGLYGGTTYVESWVGWVGCDGAFIVDLGKIQNIHHAETDFLHQLGAWILLPTRVAYSYSVDGKVYTPWQVKDIAEDRSSSVKFVGVAAHSEVPIQARYVKVEVTGTKECPSWHYGVGHDSWFFADEIIVK